MAATTTSKVLSVIRRGSCRSPLTASRILFTGNKHFQGGGRTPYLVCICGTYCTRIINRNDASLRYRDGLPVFSVPLPSRQETCEFVLKPISHTVGDFFNFMKEEDHGIDNISIYTKEGIKVAKSTSINNLLKSEFWLIVNNREYHVTPPEQKIPLCKRHYAGKKGNNAFLLGNESVEKLSDIKMLVSQLYSTLNIEQYQLERENDLLQRLEDLKLQLEPLEKVKKDLEVRAQRRTNMLSWLGLGMMGLQFGILARLTWWEYSWDIMEPVTYFVTYGTTMAMYAYFVVTKQEYNFLEVKDRQYLLSFYKNAEKKRLDVHKYNHLRDAISQVEYDLLRLRDPLQLQLPIGHIQRQKS
ncbi:calcium uniporter protein, mitochondrial isoform X2 [Octopus bimaculoides]|uniref:calcium uniporter protein, mitochondrial isoform X2 n=1 Tax=Octopus bimaculoides TaxID=37653 RepID=UPI0022E2635A|nr:calcium uniporter protein, mitochondrial isoform X2 [Octopus bimaculoides]